MSIDEIIEITNLTKEEVEKILKDLEDKVRNCINMHPVTKKDFYCKGIPKKVIGLVSNELITTDEGFSTDYQLDKDIIKRIHTVTNITNKAFYNFANLI